MQDFDIKKFKTVGIWAVIAIVAIILAIVVIKISKKFLSDEITEKQQEHLNSLIIDEGARALTDAEINNLVAKLKTAFGNYGWATDEDGVYEVFEAIENRDDLLKLITTFGVYESHTLSEWMTKELSDSELEHVQSILTSKGIIYTF